MGLDMYLFSVDAERVKDEMVDICLEPQEVKEIYYWRKQYAIHMWMHELYLLRGGKVRDFNGEYLKLTENDIKRLESDIKKKKLPEASCASFFPERKQKSYDLKGILAAKKAMKKGSAVVYYGSF